MKQWDRDYAAVFSESKTCEIQLWSINNACVDVRQLQVRHVRSLYKMTWPMLNHCLKTYYCLSLTTFVTWFESNIYYKPLQTLIKQTSAIYLWATPFCHLTTERGELKLTDTTGANLCCTISISCLVRVHPKTWDCERRTSAVRKKSALTSARSITQSVAF